MEFFAQLFFLIFYKNVVFLFFMQHAGVGVSSGPFITDMVFVFYKRIGGGFEIVVINQL
jgi:hypothetical protein